MSFVVFALPRSRTAWLSRFLSYRPWHCGHDEIRHCRTMDDVKAWFSQPLTGTVETAGAPWWRLLPRYAPDARVVVIRRPVEEVIASLMQIPGASFDRGALERNMRWADRKLGQVVRRVPGVMAVDFRSLNDEATCAAVFEHCLGLPHDGAWWSALAPINIQIDMLALIRYAAAYATPLDRLAAQARQEMLRDMGLRRPTGRDGVTFQCEPFEVWRRDGEALFSEHCITVGEAPDEWRRKNIPLMQTLYNAGAMQIMTARCNGRMFGYLMTLISPSLVSADIVSGVNTTFFASPEFPGLGLKLQRAAIRSLKERGVTEVLFEAGARGSGPRLGTMYRRLGANENGQVFRLSLKEA